MRTRIFTFLAETFIHPGIGQNEGAIDLPVAREAATDYPYVPGSGLKGALRAAAREHWPDLPTGGTAGDAADCAADNDPSPVAETGATDDPAPTDEIADSGTAELGPARRSEPSPEVADLFGRSDNAGSLLIFDLRLVLLPVRCLTASYRWLTCPHLLERLCRDQRRANGADPGWEPPQAPPDQHYLGQGEAQLQLEERTFARHGDITEEVLTALTQVFPDTQAATRLAPQLAIVSDRDFAWFARYGLPVQPRNALDPESKKSKALWFEETVPPDTLMYALVSTRGADAAKLMQLAEVFGSPAYLQVGGNETVGQGWFRVGWQGATGTRP